MRVPREDEASYLQPSRDDDIETLRTSHHGQLLSAVLGAGNSTGGFAALFANEPDNGIRRLASTSGGKAPPYRGIAADLRRIRGKWVSD